MSDTSFTITPKYIPNISDGMRTSAKNMNDSARAIYDDMAKLAKEDKWYGESYDKMVNYLNKIIPILHSVLTFLRTEVPATLEDIANIYQKADSGRIVKPSVKTPIDEITIIPASSKEGIQFDKKAVIKVRDNADTLFKSMEKRIEEIETTFNQIKWEGEAKENFKKSLKNSKDQIHDIVFKTKNYFNTNINETEKRMTQADQASTVS